MEHIVILPSDASSSVYKDNKIGHYKVNLDPPLDLSRGTWEVALLDIDYPTRWNNILYMKELNIEMQRWSPRRWGKVGCMLGTPPGSYVTVKSFATALKQGNKELIRWNHRHIRRIWTSSRSQMHFLLSSRLREERWLTFSHTLASVLGLHESERVARWDFWLPPLLRAKLKAEPYNKNLILSRHRRWLSVPVKSNGFSCKVKPSTDATVLTFSRVNLNANFRQFTVQTNIISPDTRVDRGTTGNNGGILRTFVPEAMTKTGAMTHREFVTPQYTTILEGLTTLRSIEIKVVDELGRPIQFTTGKVSVTLSIKQVGG